jgi:hypothetical protein
MAERTLLEIAQAAADELGINRPSSVVSSQDQQIQQLLALLNREGKDLAAREGMSSGWQQLRKEFTITTVANQAGYDFPTDLQYFINTTGWDRNRRWPLRGPLSPQEWQYYKSSVVGGVGLQPRFRFMAGQIHFDPTPTVSGNTVVIEYYSDTWCQSVSGTAQRLWASDTDVPLLPDDCFVLGVMWRFLKAKGLDYAEEKSSYEALVSRELSRATMAPVIHIGTFDVQDLVDPGVVFTLSVTNSGSSGGSGGSGGWGQWGGNWGSW